MDLSVDLEARGDRASAIYRALLDAVRSGRLRPGDRLPPTRQLALDLGVSRNTVATSYERMTAEGWFEAKVGAGTYVTDAAIPTSPRRKPSALVPRSGWTFVPQPVSGGAVVPPYDFRVGIPDAGLFPFDTWRRLLTAEVRLRANSPGTYADPAGLPQLREAIVRNLALSRGVDADVEDVLITNGTQQALDLVARVLVGPGDVVAVEDPGYPSAGELFEATGAKVVPVPVDEEGIRVDLIPGNAVLVFTTPSHQFPLGVPMSLTRRRELLDFSERHRMAIVEDDYDSEFRFTERPLEPLHCLDRAGRVIYVGTFSKSLLPSLRAGYLVAPESLRDALRAARQMTDGYGLLPIQAALARFMTEGMFARHVRRAAKVYGERRDLVLAELGRIPDWEPVPSAAGLHITALGPAGADTTRIRAAAAEHGIVLDSLASFSRLPTARPGLVIGYGAARTDSIRPGLKALRRILLAG